MPTFDVYNETGIFCNRINTLYGTNHKPSHAAVREAWRKSLDSDSSFYARFMRQDYLRGANGKDHVVTNAVNRHGPNLAKPTPTPQPQRVAKPTNTHKTYANMASRNNNTNSHNNTNNNNHDNNNHNNGATQERPQSKTDIGSPKLFMSGFGLPTRVHEV